MNTSRNQGLIHKQCLCESKRNRTWNPQRQRRTPNVKVHETRKAQVYQDQCWNPTVLHQHEFLCSFRIKPNILQCLVWTDFYHFSQRSNDVIARDGPATAGNNPKYFLYLIPGTALLFIMAVNKSSTRCNLRDKRHPFSMFPEDREGMAVGGAGEGDLGKMSLKQLVTWLW